MFSPPLKIKLFSREMHSFHFFGLLGFTGGVILSVLLATELGLQNGIILLLGLAAATTFFVLVYINRFLTGKENIVYYHHEICIITVGAIVLYLTHNPVARYLDIEIIGIGTFLAFGRIGCYSVGCCHGCPHKTGVRYSQAHVDTGFTWFYKDVPLLPVQLIESAYVFLTVVAGIILLFHHVQPGTVLIVYTVLYGLMRYTLEFFRGDPERPIWLGLSEAQWTTLVLITVTFVLSKAGWLPLYHWHWMILIAMTLVSAAIVYYFKKNPSKIFFNPPHIRQLAEALGALEEVNRLTIDGSDSPVNIFTTSGGLCISCSNEEGDDGIRQYTVSLKSSIIMNSGVAHLIAAAIGRLKKYTGGYELLERENGICHIIFYNTQTVIMEEKFHQTY